jgi:hypothetical protein
VNDATLLALAIMSHRDVLAWIAMKSDDEELEAEERKVARGAFARAMNSREMTVLAELQRRVSSGIVVAAPR